MVDYNQLKPFSIPSSKLGHPRWRMEQRHWTQAYEGLTRQNTTRLWFGNDGLCLPFSKPILHSRQCSVRWSSSQLHVSSKTYFEAVILKQSHTEIPVLIQQTRNIQSHWSRWRMSRTTGPELKRDWPARTPDLPEVQLRASKPSRTLFAHHSLHMDPGLWWDCVSLTLFSSEETLDECSAFARTFTLLECLVFWCLRDRFTNSVCQHKPSFGLKNYHRIYHRQAVRY